MRIQSTLTAFHFAGFLLLLGFARPVFASSDIALADMLDANGRIYNPNQLSGSVDFSGYYPVIDSCQGLVFLPQPPLTAGWNALGSGLNLTVRAIAVSGSDVYVGGNFTDAGGNSSADYIARWDGSTWNALGAGLGDQVNSIAVSGSDVYVGGQFTDAGGNSSADYIARWDGSTWNALGSGLNNWVVAIAISGSNVYVGGGFSAPGGTIAIARWDGSAWNAMGGGLCNWVYAIAISGSDIYAGGQFTCGGRNNIARWDGSAWQPMGTGLCSWVYAITISGSDVYAGGLFICPASHIARWDGSTWNAVGSGLSSNVYTLAMSGSTLYAGGLFTSRIRTWDGSTWNALGAGLGSTVYAVTASGIDVYVGGDFVNAGSNSSADYIARWEESILPVTLESFQARTKDKTVVLSWRTASESNNLGWDIEHSTDARQWQTLGFVHGKGNSSQENNYHFVHPAPASGANYYRLKQSDHNGQYKYSEVVQVMMSGNGQQTGAFYPNPARSGLVSLDYYAEKEGDLRVSVLDALGRLMINQNQPIAAARNLLQFDFSQLTPGTYSVLLDNGTSQVTRTLTIQ